MDQAWQIQKLVYTIMQDWETKRKTKQKSAVIEKLWYKQKQSPGGVL